MTNQFLITTTSSTSSTTTTIHSLVPGQSGGQPIRNTPLVVGAHSINPRVYQYSAGSGLRQYTELITAGAIILDHSPRASWLLNNVVVEPRISNGCVITRIGHEGRTVRVNESKLLSIQRVLAIFNIRKSEAFGRLQIDIRDDKGNIHILKLDLGTDYITSITICFRKAIRASTKLGNRRKNVSNSRRGKSGNTSSNIDYNPLKRKAYLVEELDDEFSKLSLKKKLKMNNNNDEHYLCSQLSRLKLKESSYLFPTLDHEHLQEKEDTQEETLPIVITEQIQTTSFDSLLGFIDIRDSAGNIHTLKSDIDPRHINSICTSKSRGGKSGNTSSNIDKRNVDELSVELSKLDIKKSTTQGFCSKFSSLTLQETEDTQEETSNPIIVAPEQVQRTLFNSTLDSIDML